MICEKVLDTLKWNLIKKESKLIKCVARMEYNGEEYWAVNGIGKKERKNINALRRVICIDDDHICALYKDEFKDKVKYYELDYSKLPYKWITISYNDYLKAWAANGKLDEHRRIYTCCERKLIARLEKESDSFVIRVVLPPCYMCQNAFSYLIDVHQNVNFEIHYYCHLEEECTMHLKQLGLLPK